MYAQITQFKFKIFRNHFLLFFHFFLLFSIFCLPNKNILNRQVTREWSLTLGRGRSQPWAFLMACVLTLRIKYGWHVMGPPKLYALTQQMVRYALIINFWHYFIL